MPQLTLRMTIAEVEYLLRLVAKSHAPERAAVEAALRDALDNGRVLREEDDDAD